MPPIPNAEPSLTQVILIALAELQDPAWNPRDFFDEEEMQNLVDYLQAGGRTEPIVIWTPSPENREDEPIGPPWAVISGKRRREAYRRLGRTHIEAFPLDIPLEDAMFMALAANRDSKPFWLSEYIRVENLKKRYEKLKQVEIIAKTGWSKTRVSQAVALTSLLNPASRALIMQPLPKKVYGVNFSEDKNGPNPEKTEMWRLSERVATQLIPLWDDKAAEASQTRAEQAVRVIVEHQLTGPQTDELVAHTLAGNHPAQFQPTAKTRKQRSGSPPAKAATNHPATLPPELADKMVELNPRPADPASTQTPNPSGPAESSGKMSGGETVLWETLAGISVITQIKAKIKKGQRPSVGETLLLAGHYLKKPFEGLAKHGIKGFFHSIHWVWKTLIESLKIVGIYPYVRAIFFLLVFLLAGWGLWDGYHNGFWHPVRVVGAKLHLPFLKPQEPPVEAEKPAAANTPLASVPSANGHHQKPLAPSSPAAQLVPINHKTNNEIGTIPTSSIFIEGRQAASPQMPWSEDQESKTDLEKETAALPPNTLIKPFAFEPNIFDGAIAGQRLQDLQDPDRYTMKRGQETDRILNVTLTSPNLIILFKSLDPFGGIVDGSNKISFYWQDVKTIHVNAIDSGTPKYQLTVIAEGEKEPFTIQCGSEIDLKHLASALEFWIKIAQGRYAPLTGIPYLNQGLVLNNEGVVDKLWAKSPMDKAGTALGDHLWSIGKITFEKQGLNDLESGLRSTPVTFFSVSDAEWRRAMIAGKPGRANGFSPKLRKIVL